MGDTLGAVDGRSDGESLGLIEIVGLNDNEGWGVVVGCGDPVGEVDGVSLGVLEGKSEGETEGADEGLVEPLGRKDTDGTTEG